MDGSPGPKQSASKMMLGSIVRRCAADIGHAPTPDEFAAWANGENQKGKGYCLFSGHFTHYREDKLLHPAGL